MKKIIVIATLLTIVRYVSHAQSDSLQVKKHSHHLDRKQQYNNECMEHTARNQNVGKNHNGMRMNDLQLSKEQSVQLKSIHDAYNKKIATLYGNKKLRPSDLRIKKATLLKMKIQKVDAVLTPSQREQMASFKQKRKRFHRNTSS